MADPGALNPEQESRLGAWKIQTRIDNESYLRRHQEVRLLLSAFTREVLLHRPENIREFAADYFTDPMLAVMIREKMSRPQPEDLYNITLAVGEGPPE
ncbi:RIIa domain-containing protein 1 [Lithobates pipiens]